MFKKLEKDIRHGIQKTSVKLKLDSERDLAREALEESNQGLAQINQIVSLKRAELDTLTENIYLIASEITAAKARIKITEAHLKLAFMARIIEKMSTIQKSIFEQQSIAQTHRGLVSHIPNEIRDAKQAEIQGKEACKKAQAAAKTIQEQLALVQPELAIFQTTMTICKHFIQAAKDLQQEQAEKTKILIETTRSGEIEKVKSLIESEEADVNIAISKQTALHIASLKETPHSEELIIYLLTKGADPKARDENDWTPIHYAIYTKNQNALSLYSANHLITEEHQQFSNNPNIPKPAFEPSPQEKKATPTIDYKRVSSFLAAEYQQLFKKFQQLEEENNLLRKMAAEGQQASPSPMVYLQSLANSISAPDKIEQIEPAEELKMNKSN